MPRLRAKVTFNLDKLKAVRERTEPGSRDLREWGKRSARKYRSFLHKRFNRFSRGGGNWKLTDRVKSGARFVLRQTHTLFRALSPVFRNLPGQYERVTKDGVETGYGGSARHPIAPMTVARLAQIHNSGEGRNPRRQIVVRPSPEVVRDMRDDLDRTVKRG